MKKIILGLVGEMAAGKGTAAKYLAEHYHATTFRFSEPLRDVLQIFDLETSREHMQRISTVLRTNFGEDILARAIAKRARLSDAMVIVVDGVRRFTDIEHLQALPEFSLVHIDADPHTRHKRYLARNENPGDDKIEFTEFMERHNAEADRHVPEVAKTATYTIDNKGTVDELYAQLDTLVTQLRA